MAEEAVTVKVQPPFYPAESPLMAEVRVVIKDPKSEQIYYEVKVAPSDVISFEVERYIRGIGIFTLVMADRRWSRIEGALNLAKARIELQYGYLSAAGVDTKQDKVAITGFSSPVYSGFVLSYKMQFKKQVAIMAMTGILNGYKLNYQQNYELHKPDNNTRISDIVTQIASAYALKPVVEPTKQNLARVDTSSSDLVEQFFAKPGQTDLQYIINNLAPNANNEDGEGAYISYIEVNENGEAELHFHTINYLAKQTNKNRPIFLFEEFGSPLSPVVDFSPSWDMSIFQLFGGESASVAGIDKFTKEEYRHRATLVNTPQSVPGQSGGTTKIDETNSTLSVQDKAEQTVATAVVAAAQGDLDAASNQVTNQIMSLGWVGAINADMVIYGTPYFKLLDTFDISVYMPTEDDDDKTTTIRHWTSGEYRIIRIVDSIRLGRFTTSVKMITTARPNIVAQPDTPGLNAAPAGATKAN